MFLTERSSLGAFFTERLLVGGVVVRKRRVWVSIVDEYERINKNEFSKSKTAGFLIFLENSENFSQDHKLSKWNAIDMVKERARGN